MTRKPGKGHELLLELGTEELPAQFVPLVLTDLVLGYRADTPGCPTRSVQLVVHNPVLGVSRSSWVTPG